MRKAAELHREFGKRGEARRTSGAGDRALAVATGLWPVRNKKLYDRKDGPQGRGYRTARNPPRKRSLGSSASFTRAELDALCQRELRGKVNRVGLAAHIALP